MIFSLETGKSTAVSKPHQHHIGNSATRRTEYFTSALSMFAPLYETVFPVICILSFTLYDFFYAVESYFKLGRLYSSICTLAAP